VGPKTGGMFRMSTQIDTDILPCIFFDSYLGTLMVGDEYC